ncbi:MAG: hypothetical protein U0995_09660 [Erythrobacter sp.]|nr:hypothetical protein [Erythrobacter sp.]MDZ4273240.1 hypothetical protein [Erythrobacter sp.]MDZ4276294.1 hypothetical protein [Erythrobacter sp.]
MTAPIALTRDIPALIDLIAERQARPFRWRRGQDCASFAAAAIAAQTGVDVLADLPRWRTRKAALAVADGLGGLIAAMDARLARIAPALAQRGDIAGLPDPLLGIRLMVVEGATLVGPGARGLERLRRDEMTLAWSVTGTPQSGALSDG